MMRSLYSGVAGLKNHQTRMDVTGNNIANVNTIGYKAGRTTFQDMLSQSVKGAASPTGTSGGVNPLQIGLGMGVASVDNIFTGGSLQATGKNTDLAVDGDGFFLVKSGMNTYYTRAGNFDFDEVGNYVIPGTGLQVMGWLADSSGNITTDNAAPVALTIPLNTAMSPKASTIVSYTAGNLSHDAPIGNVQETNIAVYDSVGTEHQAYINFTKVDDFTWSVEFYVEGTDIGATNPYTGSIVFDKDGKYLYDTFASQFVPGTPNPGSPGDTKNAADPTVDPTGTTTTTTAIVNGVGTITTVEITSAEAIYADTATPSNEYKYSAGSPVSYTDTAGTEYRLNGAGKWEEWDSGAAPPAFITGNLLPGLTPGEAPTLSYYTYTTDITVDTVTAGGTTCTFTPTNNAAVMTLAPGLSALTHFGIASNAKLDRQDGYTSGKLNRATLSINSNGIISGQFSNGQIMNLGQVALANFTNSAGLTKVGSSLFSESNNSGVARVGIAGVDGFGNISPSTLEMSNVDLSEEFTTMITTQRGFQANSRIITTSDSMLEELVNLKR